MTDTLIFGNIRTMDDDFPRAEAVAVNKGKITFVGTREEARAIRSKKVLDFGSQTILPGFIDTHVHVIPAGIFMNGADLSKAKNIKELLSVLREHIAKEQGKGFIIGAFFQDKNMEEKRFPSLQELDEIAPDRPLLICHNDLHPIALNSRAIALLKIDTAKDGVGTDASGDPTGLIEDPACMDMLGDILAKLGIGSIIDGMLRVDDYAVEHGVTTVFGKDVLEILQLRELAKELFKAEFVPMWYSNGCKDIESIKSILKDKKLRERTCICAFADGAFDGHSAALEEPYSDRPDTCGILNYTDDEMYEFTKAVHQAGLQVSFHAIGDAAIDQVLRVYERVLTEYPCADHRFRIEHFEEPKPEAIAKAAAMNVTLSMQPLLIEVCEHMDFSGYVPFIGDRVKRCSPYRSVLNAGILVGGGTDYPVTPMDVLHGAQIAMTHPVESERITLQEYLEMNTVNAARLGRLENRKGCLKAGMDADMILLDADPFEVSIEELSDIRVLKTFCMGREVYDRETQQNNNKCRRSRPSMLIKLIGLKIARLIR